MSNHFKTYSVYEIIVNSFKIYAQHFISYITVSAIFTLPLMYFYYHIQTVLGHPADVNERIIISFFETLLISTIPIVTSFSLSHLTAQVFVANKIGLGNSIKVSLAATLPLIGAGILMLLGEVVGLILLVVPAIIFYLSVVLLPQVMAFEGTGIIQSFTRSREVAKGNLMKCLIMIVLSEIIVFIVKLIIILLLQKITAQTGDLFSAIAHTLVEPFMAISMVLLYIDFRVKKEFVDAEMIGGTSKAVC